MAAAIRVPAHHFSPRPMPVTVDGSDDATLTNADEYARLPPSSYEALLAIVAFAHSTQ